MGDVAAARPDVTAAADAAVAALMSGDVFVALAADTAEQRAAGLETVLAAVADDGTRVAWVGNPLRSPLTVERFLLQIVGPEVDLRIERGPADLARLIAARRGAEGRLLVVVQQPETVNPETLEQLGALAGHLGEEAVQVQFLLVGSSALRLPTVARAEIGPLVLPPQDAEPEPPSTGARRRDVLPLILLLLAVSLGAVFSLTTPGPQTEPAVLPAPAEAAPPTSTPTSAAADTERLRRQFEAFLADRAATLPPLSQAQKDNLFAEFLTHHSRE